VRASHADARSSRIKLSVLMMFLLAMHECINIVCIAANAAIKHLTGFVFVWRRALNSAAVQKAFTPTAQFDRCAMRCY
jgi:PhoPQ-activated pathogenicity-related protein